MVSDCSLRATTVRWCSAAMYENFEAFVGIVIVANCVMLGLEAELFIGNLQHFAFGLRVADNVFTLFFNLEILFRLCAFGWRAYVCGRDSSSNMFDATLVLVTDVVWIMSSLMTDTVAPETFIRSFTAFRTIRLVRLVRVVQRVPFFREVWLLLRGISQSFRVLFWTIFVISVITYVFAIFGVVLVSVVVKEGISGTMPVQSLTQQQLQMLWESTGGVLTWMFTLIQVLTLDSWTSILRPLMLVAPWSWVLFYIYVALAVIVLLNLVTAVIVENAFKYSNLDKEEEMQALEEARLRSFERLKKLFSNLDDDGSGDISWEEFEAGFSKPEIRQQMEALDMREDELKPLFELLDTGDGVLSLDEFFTGIQRMSGTATAKETYHISKRVDHLCHLMEQNTKVFETILKTCFDEIQSRNAVFIPRGAVRQRDKLSDLISKVSWNGSTSDVHKKTCQSGDMKPLLIDLFEESSNLPQSPCSHERESELASPVASSTDDLIRKSLDELACKLDAITEDFRSQCTTLHCQVAKCFEVIHDTFDPESKIVDQKISVCGVSREPKRADGCTSKDRFLPHNEKAVANYFGEMDDSWHQTIAPPTRQMGATFLGVSARDVREAPTQPVTELACKQVSFLGPEMTAVGTTHAHHTSLR